MITAMVTSLSKLEYIIKTPLKEDKRSFTLTPTEKAVALVKQTFSEYSKTLESLRVRFGDDFNLLVSLIIKLILFY